MHCQAFVEANSGRKVVKKWVTAKIKEIADHGIAGWVIKREHPVIQTSQDLGATDENNAAAGAPLNLAAPAQDLPPEHPGSASSPPSRPLWAMVKGLIGSQV